ncbi:MAG: hypothetical protein DWI22_11530 [Planctomycetota bacterium]|nr:MAG: hypothetical protein DWI22_11530 [Planctomycetota bacterium]
MANLTGRQIARNRETQDQPSFASHRQHVMRLILDAAAGTSVRRSTSAQSDKWPTMTVIGAGNCQDIDLTTLAVAFSEIRLIDIDAVAVACAVSRLPADVTSQIRIFAPIDIAAPLMSVAAFVSLDPAQRAAVLAAVESAEMPERLPVSDVVVSACLLSQLLDSASQIAPPESSDYLPLMQAVRRGHLLRLLSLTAPGGRVLLITDLVSSDTVQELAKTLSAELPKLMFQCLQSGNFFSGLNPAVVQHDIQHIQACVELCLSSRILPPWLWHLGARSYAVYAVEMVRCAAND